MIILYFGIMQGRLSDRAGEKIQSFPWLTWELEFDLARQCGFDSIEWVFDSNNYVENPILSTAGLNGVVKLIDKTGVLVNSLCANYFMDHPFFRTSDYEISKSVEILKLLIINASAVGVKTILLPVLESSEIRNNLEKDNLRSSLDSCVNLAEKRNIRLSIETELPAIEFLELIESFESEFLGAYYDLGNAAFKGYDLLKDIAVLNNHLVGVHIKDRNIGGGSVLLGMGDVNFEKVIPFIIKRNYNGGIVFEHYYDRLPVKTAIRNLKYIKKIICNSAFFAEIN